MALLTVLLPACASEPSVPNVDELALARLRVERVRGVALGRAVALEPASDERARAGLARSTATPAGRARALARLGLVAEGVAARSSEVDATLAHAIAYYDPARRAIVVGRHDVPRSVREQALVHELVHALQDERFGLDGLRKDACASGDADPENALAMLVEGEASYATLVATLARDGTPRAVADELVAAEAELSREQRLDRRVRAAERLGASGEPLVAAAERARRLPLYAYRTLLDPYAAGAAFVAAVRREGGWDAVDRLFRGPPLTTHEVLHPERLGLERGPRAKLPDLTRGRLAGQTLLHEDTLGELGVDACLVGGLGRGGLASGWTGDRLQAYGRGARTAVLWLTTWDSEESARAILDAFDELARRDRARLEAGEASGARRSGTAVVLALGVPAAALEDVLAAALPGR